MDLDKSVCLNIPIMMPKQLADFLQNCCT